MAIQKPLEVEPTEQILPPDDPLTVTEETPEAPVDAGASPFLDEEEYLVAMGPAVRAILKKTKPELPKDDGAPKVVIDEDFQRENWTDPDALTPDELTQRVETQAVDLNRTSLDEFDTTKSHHPKYETFHLHEDGKAVMAQMAESYSKEIDEARRGEIGDQQLAELSRELGQDPEFTLKFLTRALGEAPNAETITAARAMLVSSARRLKKLAAKIDGGDDSSVTQAEFLNQFDFHKNWMAQYMGARAELGRGLRAMRGDVPGPHGGAQVNQQRMAEIAESWGAHIDVRQAAKDVLANDNLEGLNAVVKESAGGMNRYAAAFIEHFVGSILSGFKTQLVNIGGNALMTAKAPLDIYIASKMGRGLPNDGEKVLAGEATAFLYGMFNSFSDATHAAAIAFKTGQNYGGVGKFELGHNKAISSEAFNLSGPMAKLVDLYGAAARFPMERMLGPMDAFFKHINEGGTLSQLAYRRAYNEADRLGLNLEEATGILDDAVRNPDASAIQKATEFGEYQTFQSPLDRGGRHLQSFINHFPIAKFLSPFVRTPLNAAVKVPFIEHSPLGLLTSQLRRDLFPKPRIVNGKEVYEPGAVAKAQMARAKLTYGSMITFGLGYLAYHGYLTGSGPRDLNQQRAARDSGWRPRSIPVRDESGKIVKYVSYARAEPMSVIMGTVADLAEVWRAYEHQDIDQSTQEKLEMAGAALVLAISENTVNKTFLLNVHETMRAVNDPERYFGRWLRFNANALLPASGLRRDARKLFDSHIRQAQTILEEVMNGTPGLSDKLPPAQTIWGDDKQYDTIFNPNPVVDVERDIVDEEMARLLDATREAPITQAGKFLLSGSVDLTHEEHYRLTLLSRKHIKVNAAGQPWVPESYNESGEPVYGSAPGSGPFFNMRERVEQIIQTPEYNGLVPEKLMTNHGKIKMLRDQQADFDALARAWLMSNDKTIGDKVQLQKQNDLRKLVGDVRAEQIMRKEGVQPVGREGEQPFFDW